MPTACAAESSVSRVAYPTRCCRPYASCRTPCIHRHRRTRRKGAPVSRAALGESRWRGPHRVQVGVRRGIGDDVGDRYRQRFVHLVRHLVARHELAAGRVPGDDDGLQVREGVAPRQPAEELVDHVERRHFGASGLAAGRPARRPAALPVRLPLGERVGTAAVVRGEPGRNNHGVVQRGPEEGCGQRVEEIVVGVAAGAMDHDHRPRDVRVPGVEREAAVDERPHRCRSGGHPFGAGRRRRGARRGRGGCGN